MVRRPADALSLRQRQTALMATGRNRIEVCRWPSGVRGLVSIDDRRAADDLRPLGTLPGGVCGAADVTGCIAYHAATEFAGDTPGPGNDSAWFKPPRTYGFTFRAGGPDPFVPCRVSARLFRVEFSEAT